MLKKGSEILLKILFLFVLCSCSKENKVETKDVLFYVPLDSITDINKNRVDSIVLEYSELDSITQLVRRIFYSSALEKPDTSKYKLINYDTRAYIELTYDTLKSPYLDIESLEPTYRIFRVPAIPSLYGSLEYRCNIKDSVNHNIYYVFQGNDLRFDEDLGGYFYFDSIFHLKKIYNNEGRLRFSVK